MFNCRSAPDPPVGRGKGGLFHAAALRRRYAGRPRVGAVAIVAEIMPRWTAAVPIPQPLTAAGTAVAPD